MTTEETLLAKFGPLLSLPHLAQLLDRSPDGLRISLRSSTSWAADFNRARIRIGRRVYFKTADVARLIDGSGAN